MPDEMSPRGGAKPMSDPTEMTTALMLREVDRVVKLLDAKLDGHISVTETRFKAVEKEFALIEDRRKEQKVDTKVAVDAALQAAEKAVKEQTVASEKSIIKSETSAAEQSKQQYATFTASLKGVTDNVTDLKDRVGKIEAIKLGAVESRTTQRLDQGALIGLIMVVIAVVGFLLARGG